MGNSPTKTWKPIAAGFLTLIAGVIGLIRALTLLLYGKPFGGAIFNLPGFALSNYPSGLLSLIAIIGGTYALRRRSWAWVLSGVISAVFGWWILSVPAVILTLLSKNEFD
ncbi:MAG: hypothetical protein V1894_00150 [Chloroflexota bacterium]